MREIYKDDTNLSYSYDFDDIAKCLYITFKNKSKKIEFETNINFGIDLTFEELQAINKQIKELGWSNE